MEEGIWRIRTNQELRELYKKLYIADIKEKGLEWIGRVLTLRRLMSYIYGAPILDVSRSHTTTQHSR